MKTADTLYCIADDHSYRLLRGNGQRMDLVLAASSDDFADVAQAPTEPGRNRSGGISFGHETRRPVEIERPRLAKRIVAALEAEWQKGGAGRIVLVAGPKMLGALRQAMPKTLEAEIAQEIDKDLSDIPDHALAAHLAG